MKRILIFLTTAAILFSLICLSVSAEENLYKRQFDASDAEELKNSLDKETRNLFNDIGIDPGDSTWVNKISDENVWKHISDFLFSGLSAPLKASAAIFSIIIITAAITAFKNSPFSDQTVLYTCSAAIAAIISAGVISAVAAAANAMKACATFMLGFIPIFTAIAISAGNALTAASMSTLLLAASEAVSMISSFFIMPFMGGYLSLSLGCAVSPLLARSSIADIIKRFSLWAFSLFTTLFVGILGIQTAVNAAADNLASKTAKYILGTTVPLTGAVLAEAAATVSASIGLLKSSIGIYGVFAVAVMILPIIAELIIWRIGIMLCSAAAESFSLSKTSELLKAVDSMLSILLGLILLVAGLFIISLTVVISAGKAL